MKPTIINRSAASTAAAASILSCLRGETTYRGATVTIDAGGDLRCYAPACGTEVSENILFDHLERDSMGDGWESGKPLDVIEWLENAINLTI